MIETLREVSPSYITSLREANFQLYVLSLKALMKWFFALDHYNYASWLSVHLFDLLSLKNSLPDIYQNFKDGHSPSKSQTENF